MTEVIPVKQPKRSQRTVLLLLLLYMGKGKFFRHGRFGTIIRDNSFVNRISSSVVLGAKRQVS